MAKRPILLAALLAIVAAPAMAQPINVLGTVDTADAGSLKLMGADGAVETYRLVPETIVVQAKPATLADIKPGDFVASAAVRKADGKLHSTELRIFPPAMRGVGEGQRPMNDPASQTMTNATVTGAAIVSGSNDIQVTFAGGQSELILDPGVPVTRLDVADMALVKAGAKVRVQGTRTADAATVNRITMQ